MIIELFKLGITAEDSYTDCLLFVLFYHEDRTRVYTKIMTSKKLINTQKLNKNKQHENTEQM